MTEEVTETVDKSEDELTGLKKKNRELLGINKSLKTDLEKLREEFDEIRSGLEETTAKKENDIEKALAARDQKHAREKAQWEAEKQKLTAALDQHLVEGQALQAISSADGISKLLLPHVKRRLKTVEEDGQYRTVVLDADGNPTDQSVQDLIAEYRNDADFAGAFRASGIATGTGVRPQSSIQAGENPYARGPGYSLTRQAELEQTNPAKAQALRAAAGSGTTVAPPNSSRTGLRPVKMR